MKVENIKTYLGLLRAFFVSAGNFRLRAELLSARLVGSVCCVGFFKAYKNNILIYRIVFITEWSCTGADFSLFLISQILFSVLMLRVVIMFPYF